MPLALLAATLAGCAQQTPAAAPAQPTADVGATIQAAVRATVQAPATPAPTASPSLARPTPAPPSPTATAAVAFWVRAAPGVTGPGDRGYPAGALVSVSGEPKEIGGERWVPVRVQDGFFGWVVVTDPGVTFGQPLYVSRPTDEPSPTPAPVTVSEYLRSVDQLVRTEASTWKQLDDQTRILHGDMSQIDDQKWQEETYGIAEHLAKAAERLQRLTAPAEATNVQGLYSDFAEDMLYIANEYEAGIRSRDFSRINNGIDRMETATKKMYQAGLAADALAKAHRE